MDSLVLDVRWEITKKKRGNLCQQVKLFLVRKDRLSEQMTAALKSFRFDSSYKLPFPIYTGVTSLKDGQYLSDHCMCFDILRVRLKSNWAAVNGQHLILTGLDCSHDNCKHSGKSFIPSRDCVMCLPWFSGVNPKENLKMEEVFSKVREDIIEEWGIYIDSLGLTEYGHFGRMLRLPKTSTESKIRMPACYGDVDTLDENCLSLCTFFYACAERVEKAHPEL